MKKRKKGLILILLFTIIVIVGEFYLNYETRCIKRNQKIGSAFIYDTDNQMRYRHYRVRYQIRLGEQIIDSSFSIRDDLSSDVFTKLKGTTVPVAFDSTNPKKHNCLLITSSDYKKFGDVVNDVNRGNVSD